MTISLNKKSSTMAKKKVTSKKTSIKAKRNPWLETTPNVETHVSTMSRPLFLSILKISISPWSKCNSEIKAQFAVGKGTFDRMVYSTIYQKTPKTVKTDNNFDKQHYILDSDIGKAHAKVKKWYLESKGAWPKILESRIQVINKGDFVKASHEVNYPFFIYLFLHEAGGNIFGVRANNRFVNQHNVKKNLCSFVVGYSQSAIINTEYAYLSEGLQYLTYTIESCTKRVTCICQDQK